MSTTVSHPVDPRSTRTDLRLTRSPADTPRGRLHRAAAVGLRVAQEAARIFPVDAGVDELRQLVRRVIGRARQEAVPETRFVADVWDNVDRALRVLVMLSDPGYASICASLTDTLVQLEATETKLAELEAKYTNAKRDLAIERGHNEQARTSLAAVQVRAAAAEIKKESWDEPTRSRPMSDAEKRVVTDPDAQVGDLERHLQDANDLLRTEYDKNLRATAEMRNEARSIYAAYTMLVERLSRFEDTAGAVRVRKKFRETLLRLGVYDLAP